MSSRQFWGWFKHIWTEARCHDDITNLDDNSTIEHHSDVLNFHSDIFQRTYGGVPLKYYFGGCRQLSHIGMKHINDMPTRSTIKTSNLWGGGV